MTEHERTKFFVTVYNCRQCGSVIPTSEGVRKHVTICRLPSNSTQDDAFHQMNVVKFPCPLVTLTRIRIPFHLDQRETKCMASSPPRIRNTRHRRRQALEIDEDDGDVAEPTKRRRKSDKTPTGSRHINKGVWGKSFRRKITVDESLNKFVCPVDKCGARLKCAQQLKVHFIMHLENNPYACPVRGCDVKYGNPTHFNRHIDWHMGRNILSCEKCGQTCADSTRLKKHMSRCKRKRHCQPHKREIKTLEDMRDILKSHYTNLESKGLLMNYKDKADCDEDDELGLLKLRRTINMDFIIKSDPVFLKVCEGNPAFKDDLLQRKRKSDKPKQFQCLECNKSYNNLSCYKEHYSKAHRDRPYKCSRCARNFAKKGHLEQHMKYHESTGNNIYMKKLKNGHFKCTKCSFESRHNGPASIKRHWRTQHKISIPSHHNRNCNTNIKSAKKIDIQEGSCDHDEENSHIVKIESEPPLELTMITIPNDDDVKAIIPKIKIEPQRDLKFSEA